MPNGEIWQAAIGGKEQLEVKLFTQNFVEQCMDTLDEEQFKQLVRDALRLTKDDLELV